MRPLWVLCGSLFLLPAFAREAVDLTAIDRIVDEAMNRSELPETAAYLCDRIGGRMTNSPQMRVAEQWAQGRFRAAGLTQVRAEGFEFGRGWSIESSSVRMLTPRLEVMRGIPVAWTPATRGTIKSAIVVAPMARVADFERWRGKLRGKIVLVTQPDSGSEPEKPAFRRFTAEDLAKFDEYKQPVQSAKSRAKKLRDAMFEARRDAFLAAEGATAWIGEAWRDGGVVHGEGYGYKVGETPALPGMELAAEDYRKLARLAKAGLEPTIEMTSQVSYHDGDTKAYNIVADIPGSDPKAGYVMAGAHLDSWVAADGAQDNGAGSVVVLEAARILAKLHVRPKRSIRLVLWSGEEQGMLGSAAYVQQYLAQRAPLADPQEARIDPFYTWGLRWPITPLKGYGDMAAYFNLDNGSGKVRGIYAEGNLSVVPIFKEWLAPFASMGADKVVAKPTGGTDHVFMQQIGLPAFELIQDPLDYGSRTHHSSVDTYDHLKMADLKQATVVLTSLLLLSAEREEPLPRLPIPTQPLASDPFEFPDLNDDGA